MHSCFCLYLQTVRVAQHVSSFCLYAVLDGKDPLGSFWYGEPGKNSMPDNSGQFLIKAKNREKLPFAQLCWYVKPFCDFNGLSHRSSSLQDNGFEGQLKR